MKWSWLLVTGLLLSVAAFVAYGCGTDRLGTPEGAAIGTPTPGAGCSDGQVRDCHRLLSEHGSVRTCTNGTQACKAGAWTECGGTNQSISTLALPPGAHFLASAQLKVAGLSTASLSLPSPEGGICLADPCDPYCMAFDECDGGATCTIAAEGGPPPNLQGNPGNPGVPPVQLGNLFQDRTYAGDRCDDDPMYSHCQADTFCFPDRDRFAAGNDITNVATSPVVPNPNYESCTHFQSGNHYTATACAGVDLTVQSGCSATGTVPPGVPTGDSVVAVCNRGSVAMAATPGVGLTFTTPALSGLPRDVPPSACFTSTTPTCTVNLPALNPGECYGVDLGATTCGNQTGIGYYSVNQNGVVAECMLSAPFLRFAQSPQLGCAENWAAQDFSSAPACTAYGSPSPGVAVQSQYYTATCANPSTSPQWTLLTYDTGGPSTAFSNASGSGEVIIQASTAPGLPNDGGPGTYGTIVPVADACDATKLNCVASVSPPPTKGDPGQCSMTGPFGCSSVPDAAGPYGPCCPKSLYDALGSVDANNPYLKLDFTVKTTPDGALSPTLQAWQVAYTCVPNK